MAIIRYNSNSNGDRRKSYGQRGRVLVSKEVRVREMLKPSHTPTQPPIVMMMMMIVASSNKKERS